MQCNLLVLKGFSVCEYSCQKCFGPQRKSHVVGFVGGITTKEFKGCNSSKVASLDKLNASEKGNDFLKKRMDELENK
ncbi:hypothetical protein H5410_057634 [Solanum commersonii]|uniref:Uncharacterized protein n=1 Tax=Solanum commersonii TaxID=4109 RepID=A0A9J5WQR7_SOLCO|nr:hypothetical protein H5410_057634 [Solanum commersonii]